MWVRVCVVLFFCVQLMSAQKANSEVVAKIKASTQNGLVKVTAEAINTTQVYKSLRFVFSVFTTESAMPETALKKEERFTLEANEQKTLGYTLLEFENTKKTVVLLLIYEEDKIIGKDRLAFNEKKQEALYLSKEALEVNDGLELSGIVVDETKTKPGKDFYDFFYTSYSLNGINGNKVVGVYETLSFGRSTIIQIKIEDNLIHEFLGKPDLEYLEQMSKVAIRRVFKYFQDQKKQKKDIFQY